MEQVRTGKVERERPQSVARGELAETRRFSYCFVRRCEQSLQT